MSDKKKLAERLQIALIRPGSTDFEDERRIRGTLDIPLNINGTDQVAQTKQELDDQRLMLDVIYCSPCRSAVETAKMISNGSTKVKEVSNLKNVDHGLWHGKLISELKHTQPKAYRQWQDNPESVCPPEGETLDSAQNRVQKALVKILKKHRTGTIALVVSEPLASVVESLLKDCILGDLWKAKCDCGSWELISNEAQPHLSSRLDIAQ